MSTVVITGANRGLGLEMAKQFAEAGWMVVAAARDPERGAELKQFASKHKNIELAKVDVSNEASVAEFKKQIGARAIDILINNAGMYPTKGNTFGDVDYKAWIDTLNTNSLGPVRVTEALVDNVAKSEKKLVVVISSQMGSIDVTLKENAASGEAIQYRSSKTTVNMAVALMSIALKPKNVTVIAQCPGWVQTDMGGKNAHLTPEQSIGMMRKIWDGLTLDDTGKYFAHTGKNVAW